MASTRQKIAALVLSTVGLGGIALHEGYRDTAYVPVPGDKVTIGYGATSHEDGSPIKPGEKITQQRAMDLLYHHTNKFQAAVRKCTPVPMYQYEFDAFVSLTYNIGESAYCNSTLAKKLNAYDYAGACAEILKWNKFQGRILPGLDNRRKKEYEQCLGNSQSYSLIGK